MSIFTNELAMFFFFRPYGAVFIFFCFVCRGLTPPVVICGPFRAALAIATDAVRNHRVAALKGRYDHRRGCKPASV